MAIKPTISSIVLVKNEEARIAKCLESLAWTDEIIVVDNGSTDQTTAIACKHKAKVVLETQEDYAKLRNRGQDEAFGDWLLYVDADEQVSDELQQEIIQVIKSFNVQNSPHSFFLKRKNYYLGHAWSTSDRMQRLFWKPSLVKWYGILHETAIVKGKTGELANPLIHKTHRNLGEMVEKTNRWSKHEAELRYAASHPQVTWWRFLRVMITAFYKSYISEKGWQAGTIGLIESIYQAFSMFITYAKLWEIQVSSKFKVQSSK